LNNSAEDGKLIGNDSQKSIDDQLSLWKNFADSQERQEAMQKNFELKMGAIVHKYSQNDEKIEKAF
jgi:superfamily I DNA and/or RNA helicase